MFRLVYLAHPKPSHDDYGDVDGAYATCWVNDPTESLADSRARDFLEEIGWDVESLDEAEDVSEVEYPADSEARDRVDQARIDGIVVSLHQWPVSASDDDGTAGPE